MYNSSVRVVMICSYWRLAVIVYEAYPLRLAAIDLLFISKTLIFQIESEIYLKRHHLMLLQ